MGKSKEVKGDLSRALINHLKKKNTLLLCRGLSVTVLPVNMRVELTLPLKRMNVSYMEKST